MKKKALKQNLIDNGFELGEYGHLVGNFDGIKLGVHMLGLFGNVSKAEIYYHFNRTLSEDQGLIDEIWDAAEFMIKGKIDNFVLEPIDYTWVNVSISGTVNKITDYSKVIACCDNFSKAIKPILDQYNI